MTKPEGLIGVLASMDMTLSRLRIIKDKKLYFDKVYPIKKALELFRSGNYDI